MSAKALALRTEQQIHMVARDPVEMQSARAGLEVWLRAKMQLIDSEVVELDRAFESAKSRHFSTTVQTSIRSQINRATRRRRFYEKVLAAVQANYTIIPNFPLEVFAIRVTKKKPNIVTDKLDYQPDWPAEKSTNAALGEGDFKNPNPMTIKFNCKEIVNDKERTRYYIQATDWSEVEFPLIAARAEVLDATSTAMQRKVFDRIGICPPGRQPDPLIIGQVCLRDGYEEKVVSFIIAWHLDLRTL